MRTWSLLLGLPLVVACASIIGLEEGEPDSNAPAAGRGGQGGKSGAGTGTGGKGAAECSYSESVIGDACLTDCFNDACCAEASVCLGDGCDDYWGCVEACESDLACTQACRTTYPVQAARFAALTACTVTCGCNLGGSGGSGGGGPGPTPEACTATDPQICVNELTVRWCLDGYYETRACSTRCGEVGFAPGPCVGDGCSCGEPMDAECARGAQGYCACQEGTAEPCTNDVYIALYYQCYTHNPEYEAGVRCLANYVNASGQIQCEDALACVE